MKSRSKPAFLTWLSQQARRDDPVDDIARDMLDDPDWPADATAFVAGRAYLQSVRASSKAIDALQEAWREWSRQ